MPENELELTTDQITAVIETWEKIRQVVYDIWESIKAAIIECAKQLWETFVKPLIRHLFLMQLIEWKVPFWLARILQKITPWCWLHKIGLKYWQKKFA